MNVFVQESVELEATKLVSTKSWILSLSPATPVNYKLRNKVYL